MRPGVERNRVFLQQRLEGGDCLVGEAALDIGLAKAESCGDRVLRVLPVLFEQLYGLVQGGHCLAFCARLQQGKGQLQRAFGMFRLQSQRLLQCRYGGLDAMVGAHRHAQVVLRSEVRRVDACGGAEGAFGRDMVAGLHQCIAKIELIQRTLRPQCTGSAK